MPLAVDRAGCEDGPKRLHQRRIQHRPDRPRSPGRLRSGWQAMAVDRCSGCPPDPAYPGQAIGPAAAGRDRQAHGRDLRRTKGRPPSRAATLASSNSRSSSISPSFALSRSLSSASPSLGRVARLASPAAEHCGGHTQRPRHRLQVRAMQQPQHRIPLALPRHPATPSKTGRVPRFCRRCTPLRRIIVRLRDVSINRGAEDGRPAGDGKVPAEEVAFKLPQHVLGRPRRQRHESDGRLPQRPGPGGKALSCARHSLRTLLWRPMPC